MSALVEWVALELEEEPSGFRCLRCVWIWSRRRGVSWREDLVPVSGAGGVWSRCWRVRFGEWIPVLEGVESDCGGYKRRGGGGEKKKQVSNK